jgi:hypothetical protein
MDLSSQQVSQICKGDEEIAGFFHALLDQNRTLKKQNAELQALVQSQAK